MIDQRACVVGLTAVDQHLHRKHIDYHAAGVEAVESISILSCDVAVEIASTSAENLASCCLCYYCNMHYGSRE